MLCYIVLCHVMFKDLRHAADLFFFQIHDLRGREVLNRKRVSILVEMYSNPMYDANIHTLVAQPFRATLVAKPMWPKYVIQQL